MNTPKSFNKETILKLESVITAALSQLNSGIKFEFVGGNYNPTTATLKLRCFLPADGAESPEAANFKRNSSLYGFAAADLGRTFMFRGNKFELTGLHIGRTKYPLCATCLTGPKAGTMVRIKSDKSLIVFDPTPAAATPVTA